MMAPWKVAPALAAGGHRGPQASAEWTPLTAFAARRSSPPRPALPAGVLNIVQGYGSEIGDALTRTPTSAASASPDRCPPPSTSPPPRPRNLTPTGFDRRQVTAVGVLPPTPTSTWPPSTWPSSSTTIAQVRLAATRILVEEPIAEEFTRRFTEKAAGIQQGDLRD
ncbi:aldehyde dehydrogenase family protein [Streptomyces sp. KL116D]|uniref:aldehyde dehydrogenase family protein n=1 Tax=Streptomyces sp. KL116D TaxID=3045152 RepID=UPI003556E6E1